jgi:hypothetical protein
METSELSGSPPGMEIRKKFGLIFARKWHPGLRAIYFIVFNRDCCRKRDMRITLKGRG